MGIPKLITQFDHQAFIAFPVPLTLVEYILEYVSVLNLLSYQLYKPPK